MGLALFLTDTAHEKNIKTAYYELQNLGRVRSCLYSNKEQTNPINVFCCNNKVCATQRAILNFGTM